MSSKKEKFLENATKYIVKGQIDRAINEYKQLLQIDPSDFKNRQKLAELLVRDGRKDEAIAEYSSVGQYYSKNSFYLKAIAVYKQIQKLDPANPSIPVTLADLNIKQGMTGNAMAELNSAIAIYESEGNFTEVQNVLKMMSDIDPENLQLRFKSAEILVKNGKKDEGFKEFIAIASQMLVKGNDIALKQLLKRISDVFPGAENINLSIAASLAESGNISNAVELLNSEIQINRKNITVWNLYLDCLKKYGDNSLLISAYNQMLLIFPDDPTPRKALIQDSIENASPDSALDLIDTSRRVLLAAGLQEFLEESYLKIKAKMPFDPRPIESLAEFYRQIESTKLSAVEEELASLTNVSSTAEQPADVGKSGIDIESETVFEEIDFSELEIEDASENNEQLEAVDENSSSKNEEEPVEAFTIDWDSDEELDIGDINLITNIPSDDSVQADSDTTDKKSSGKRIKLGTEVDASELDTFYDLAIAYKEMGLYDEAIQQLEHVASDPVRRADSVTLQGLCSKEKGDLQGAEASFRKVIALKVNESEKLCAMYELALIQISSGKKKEAKEILESIINADPDYREVKTLISELS